MSEINFNVNIKPSKPLEYTTLSFKPEDLGCETMEELETLLKEVLEEMEY
jgi:hypothetical protein